MYVPVFGEERHDSEKGGTVGCKGMQSGEVEGWVFICGYTNATQKQHVQCMYVAQSNNKKKYQDFQ